MYRMAVQGKEIRIRLITKIFSYWLFFYIAQNSISSPKFWNIILSEAFICTGGGGKRVIHPVYFNMWKALCKRLVQVLISGGGRIAAEGRKKICTPQLHQGHVPNGSTHLCALPPYFVVWSYFLLQEAQK